MDKYRGNESPMESLPVKKKREHIVLDPIDPSLSKGVTLLEYNQKDLQPLFNILQVAAPFVTETANELRKTSEEFIPLYLEFAQLIQTIAFQRPDVIVPFNNHFKYVEGQRGVIFSPSIKRVKVYICS